MMWQTLVNIVLGAMVAIVAFMGLSEGTMVWTFSVLGVVIIVVELLEALAISDLTKKGSVY